MATNIKELAKLQTICADVFTKVTTRLQAGMSEADIAGQLNQAFRARGIEEHWYDVPFNVLIGTDRFVEGLTTSDYSIKAPSAAVRLGEGAPLYIDVAPVDPQTKQWGDWSSTAVFRPRQGVDDEQIAFLKEMREIHLLGIAQITSQTTGAEVAAFYQEQYKRLGVTLLDVRNNVGHSLHDVPNQKLIGLGLTPTTTSHLAKVYLPSSQAAPAPKNKEPASSSPDLKSVFTFRHPATPPYSASGNWPHLRFDALYPARQTST